LSGEGLRRSSTMRFKGRDMVTVREFLTNVAMLSTIMAVAGLIEVAVPMFSHRSWTRGRRAANLVLTAVVFLLNWLLSSATAILALAMSLQPPAVARGLSLPTSNQIVAGIVTLDLTAGYLAHRAQHRFPILWQFHRVHHSDDSWT
jgi:sterol desaturase/sphingolipid hydroxylase (fatty acid hydroxylase superfamily)